VSQAQAVADGVLDHGPPEQAERFFPCKSALGLPFSGIRAERNNPLGEIRRLFGNQNVTPVHEGKTLDRKARGHDRNTPGHGFENLETGASA
jgi:hypothetical protein